MSRMRWLFILGAFAGVFGALSLCSIGLASPPPPSAPVDAGPPPRADAGPTHVLKGQLVGPTKEIDFEGALVELIPRNDWDEDRWARVDAKNRFVLDGLPAEPRRLRVKVTGYQPAVVELGAKQTSVDISLRQGATLLGTVGGLEEDASMDWSQVVVRDAATQRVIGQWHDLFLNFQLRDLPPGDAIVTYTPGVALMADNPGFASRRVKLVAGQTTEVEFRLEPRRTLHARVKVDGDEGPSTPLVLVVLRGDVPLPRTLDEFHALTGNAWGQLLLHTSWTFNGLGPGTYTVLAVRRDVTQVARKVVTIADQDVEVTVPLPPDAPVLAP